MNRHRIPLLTVATLAFALLAALAIPGVHSARAEEPVKITVKVEDDRFTPDTIELVQGALVEITFEWASKAHPENTHIIVLDGLKLESELISAKNPKSTVKLVATNAGTFGFKCDVECEGHETLQKGTIKVKAGASGGASNLQPSKISVESSGVFVQSNKVTLAAFLLDSSGQPIPKAEVTFYSEEEFVGQKGLVWVGTAKTTPTGLAKVVYYPTDSAPSKLVIRFEGAGIYDASEQTIDLPGNRLFGPAPAPDHVSLGILRSGAPVVLVGIIGSIWAMFAFILYQAWSVRNLPGGGR